MTPIAISTQNILIVMMMMCRSGGVFFLIPPMSDGNVRPIIRFVMTLALSILMYSQTSELIRPTVIAVADNSLSLILLIMIELCLGIALGTIVKIIFNTMQVTGLTIASQMGLSSASMMDPAQQSQNSMFGFFLSMLTTIAMLEGALHIQIICGVFESYNKIPIGAFFNSYDTFISVFIGAISKMWSVGLQLSGPFILINIVIMIASGILAKLMPQLQVFFVMLPVQILIGMIIFLMILSGILFWFLEFFTNEINLIF